MLQKRSKCWAKTASKFTFDVVSVTGFCLSPNICLERTRHELASLLSGVGEPLKRISVRWCRPVMQLLSPNKLYRMPPVLALALRISMSGDAEERVSRRKGDNRPQKKLEKIAHDSVE